MTKKVYTYNDEVVEYSINENITISDKIIFTKFMAEHIDIDGLYIPFVKDLFFNYAFINVFTDIEKFRDEEVSLDDIDDFVKKTDIVDEVKNYLGIDIVNELNNSVNKIIEYRFGINENSFDNIMSGLFNFVKDKINSIDMSDINSESITQAYAKVFLKENMK